MYNGKKEKKVMMLSFFDSFGVKFECHFMRKR